MSRLISHSGQNESLEDCLKAAEKRIRNKGDLPYVTVEKQLEILHQLTEFNFGRFLIMNRGVNGYFTHYFLTHPWYGRKTGKNDLGDDFTEVEAFVLDRAPVILATQQRFEIFLKENQDCVKNGAKLACIPSGMMGELFYLNFENISTIELVGVDYDALTFEDAKTLAKKQKLEQFASYVQRDAWALEYENEFDLISSNGLNIYEPDDDKVTALYQNFHKALKPGGKLVTSFVTPPPAFSENSEWDMSYVSGEDALMQKIIVGDVVGAKWQCFRSSELTRQQLESAGFKDIQFIYDPGHVFPTVVATS